MGVLANKTKMKNLIEVLNPDEKTDTSYPVLHLRNYINLIWYGVGSRGAILNRRLEGVTTIDLAEKVPAEHLSFLYIQ